MSCQPVYPESKTTLLEFSQARLHLQAKHNVPNAAMESLSQLDQAELPPGNTVMRHSQVLHLLDASTMGRDLDRRVHMCPADHVAFVDSPHLPTRQFADLIACPVCGAPRYHDDGTTPRKVFHYMPLGPQLAALFARDDLTAQLMQSMVPPDDPSEGYRRCDEHHKSRARRDRMQKYPEFAKRVHTHTHAHTHTSPLKKKFENSLKTT